MKSLLALFFLSFIASSFAGENLVGTWKVNLDKVKASKAYTEKGSPKWVDMFATISAEFTKDGDLIQYKSGKVMMKLKYKVVSEKGNILHVSISAPGENGSENYIVTFNTKDEMVQVLADKGFQINKNDLPIIFVKLKK